MAADKNHQSTSIAISVVVPVRNEQDSVRALLDGLLAQTLRPNEIVITDGGSTDSTRDIIEEEFVKAGRPVRLLREEFSMPGRARNIGAANARNEWIAFTDAGNRPEPAWLEMLARNIGGDRPVDVVYGSYDPVIDSFFAECAAIAYVPPRFETEKGFVRPLSIVSALMRREVWKSVGGFPEELRSAEDLLFMRKVEQAAYRMVREPDAIVHWNIQPNLGRTFKRFAEYSLNNIRAGLFAEWQGMIFIYYALIAASAVQSLRFGFKGLLAPPLLWLLFLLMRAIKAIYRNRRTYPASWARNFARVFLLVPIFATIDAAAFVGVINWFMRDRLGLGK
jgi:glycosyltransferase involved in cell wall biosynthesis